MTEDCLSVYRRDSKVSSTVPGVEASGVVTLSGLLPPRPSKTVKLVMGLKGLQSQVLKDMHGSSALLSRLYTGSMLSGGYTVGARAEAEAWTGYPQG